MKYNECIIFHADFPDHGIKRVVVTTTLDDFTGGFSSSTLKIHEQHTGIRFMADGTPLLHYSYLIW